MRISVVINSKAGSVNESLIREKIETSLFRCDLHFAIPTSLEKMGEFIKAEILAKTNNLIVCGGDGTINACLQQLMPLNEAGLEIPPVTLICSGTANDLVHEVGISRKIERAARGILEGHEKKVDIVEVIAEGRKAYMVTNGGLGIPALTAQLSNQLRQGLDLSKPLVRESFQRTFKFFGSGLYSAMLVRALWEWDEKDWSLEIETSRQKIITKSSLILFSNQPSLGMSFNPAPYTSNSDGTINILIIEAKTIPEKLDAIWKVRQGRIDKIANCHSFEDSEISIRSLTSRKITFFGDGEVLHRDVGEIEIRCLYQVMPLLLTKT